MKDNKINNPQSIGFEGITVAISLQGDLVLTSSKGDVLPLDSTLEELKASQKLKKQIAIVWLPTEKVILTKLDVPGKSRKHWQAALPFVAEESLIEPIENYHFTIYNRENNITDVAITTHQDMQNWQASLEQHGLSHALLVPDCFRIPLEQNHTDWIWQVATDSKNHVERLITRTSHYEGFATNPELFNHIKQLKQSEADADADETNDLETQSIPPSKLLNSHSEVINQVAKLNLNQGAYKPNITNGSDWLAWKWFALLVVLSIGVLLANQIIQTQKIKSQAEYTKQKNVELFKKMFPETKRIVNIKSQATSKLKQVTANTSNNNASIATVMNQINSVFQQVKNVTLTELEWRGGKASDGKKLVKLTVSAPSSKDIQQLAKQAEKQPSIKFNVTLKTVNSKQAEGVIYVDAN